MTEIGGRIVCFSNTRMTKIGKLLVLLERFYIWKK